MRVPRDELDRGLNHGSLVNSRLPAQPDVGFDRFAAESLHEDALRLPDHHLICIFQLLLRHGGSPGKTLCFRQGCPSAIMLHVGKPVGAGQLASDA